MRARWLTTRARERLDEQNRGTKIGLVNEKGGRLSIVALWPSRRATRRWWSCSHRSSGSLSCPRSALNCRRLTTTWTRASGDRCCLRWYCLRRSWRPRPGDSRDCSAGGLGLAVDRPTAVALGILQPGCIDQSLFSADYREIETWEASRRDTFIAPLGVSAHMAGEFHPGPRDLKAPRVDRYLRGMAA